MNKFASKSFQPTAQSGGEGGGSNVDWDALNKHVAGAVQEATGCEEGSPAATVAVISGVVDYGRHQDEERVEPMTEGDENTKAWKQRMVEKKKATVDGQGMFHYQANPCQEVGIFLDIPSVIADKGQFFGDSNPAPYRVLLGGVFKGVPQGVTKVQGYPNDKNTWVFGDKNRATKLAKAAKLPNLKDGFAQERLLELIGKPIQVNVEVFVNDAGFLQEKITNPAPLMAGIPLPEYDDNLLFYVGLNEDNDDRYVSYLTKPVKEYIKTALDYEGSKLQKQLEALESKSNSSETSTNTKPTPEPQKPSQGVAEPKVNSAAVDFDDDIPFIYQGVATHSHFVL